MTVAFPHPIPDPVVEEPAALFGFSYARSLTLLRRLRLAPSGALRICRVLAGDADLYTGRGFVSVAWLMDGACVSERSVQYWLREAEQAGLVVLRVTSRGFAFQLTSRPYDLVREAQGQLALLDQAAASKKRMRGATLAPLRAEGVQGLHPHREELSESISSAPAALAAANNKTPNRLALPEDRPSASGGGASRRRFLERIDQALTESRELVEELPPLIAQAALLEADRAIDSYCARGVACTPTLIRRRVLRDALDAHQRRIQPPSTAPARKDRIEEEREYTAADRDHARRAVAEIRARLHHATGTN